MRPLENLKTYDIILASASPRRQELLKDLGIDFRVEIIEGVNEIFPEYMPTNEIAEHLSKIKAEAYKKLLVSNQLIITADTIVVCDGNVLGKPKSKKEAFEMLKSLSGKTHKVLTGVTIKTRYKESSITVSTDVKMAEIKNDEINDYIDGYKPMDKAGAYGIREWIGCIAVKNINGSFYNVMGLP